MLAGKGLLSPIQKAFLHAFVQLPDQQRFYLAGGTALAECYLGHRLSFDLAVRKDPGFDLYWFAVALNRASSFTDELERWPVKMLWPLDPVALKRSFRELADDLLRRLTPR